MSSVHASIVIPAPAQRVWDVVMDPRRLGDWVTIHRGLEQADTGEPRTGFQMHQRIALRGVEFRVHWELVRCSPSRCAVWEGHGPARSSAHIEYVLAERDDATEFDYRNDFHAPLGPLGAAASRALVAGVSEREAHRSLQRLRRLFDAGATPAPAG